MYKDLYRRFSKGLEFYQGKTCLAGLPQIFEIELTNICPMDCVMCPRKKMTRKLGHMNLGLFKKVIDEAKYIYNLNPAYYSDCVWLHHFGESLLYPDLGEVFLYLKDTKFITGMSSNPTELTEEKIKIICDGRLRRLLLAIDGTTDEEYKSIRGERANLNSAIENINNLIIYKKKHNLEYPKITISMIVMKGTEGNIEKYKRQWEIEGVENVRIKQFDSFAGDNRDIKPLIPEGTPRKNYAGFGPIKKSDIRFLKDTLKKLLRVPQCSWPWQRLTILWDGTVVPCCRDYDGLYVLGNINNKPLLRIWNDEPMRNLRKQAVSHNLKLNKLCNFCRVVSSKKGGVIN